MGVVCMIHVVYVLSRFAVVVLFWYFVFVGFIVVAIVAFLLDRRVKVVNQAKASDGWHGAWRVARAKRSMTTAAARRRSADDNDSSEHFKNGATRWPRRAEI
jgi:hypothetical protein